MLIYLNHKIKELDYNDVIKVEELPTLNKQTNMYKIVYNGITVYLPPTSILHILEK
jgi:hypothetical protein